MAARTNIVNANQPMHTHGISVMLPVKPSVRPALVLETLSNAARSAGDVLNEPQPIVSVRRATNDAIEYEIVCYVGELGKKIAVRNELFDLEHRHLLSRGVVLWPLSVPEPVIAEVDERQCLLRNVLIFRTLEDDEIAELARQLTKHEFDVAETIYTAADESGHELHILARGVAKAIVLARPITNATAAMVLVCGVLGTMAMGVQNARGRLLQVTGLPNTVMTGNVTQIVLDVIELIHRGTRGGHGQQVRERLQWTLAAMSGFAGGAILGALAFVNLSFIAIALPVVVLLILAWMRRGAT
ncbi:YoaK family protein [Paraburkholderia sp. CI3]|uniref:YoaK family protein n=1 Tax=Paraburkholderia sp. CI3 TaxID=2991060 RepID=UPI003D1945D4